MLKDKIFSLVQEKFENEMNETLKGRFENFEANLEMNKNVQSCDGFIAFVDGFICLSSLIYTDSLINSGNTPKYLQAYINRIDELAREHAEENGEDEEERDDIYYNYIAEDVFYLEINFYFYDKDGHGKGKDKVYFDYSIKNEYGKLLNLVNHKELDEICATDTEINKENYMEVVTKAIEKIINFV
jgi:hypothetical protein